MFTAFYVWSPLKRICHGCISIIHIKQTIVDQELSIIISIILDLDSAKFFSKKFHTISEAFSQPLADMSNFYKIENQTNSLKRLKGLLVLCLTAGSLQDLREFWLPTSK